MGKIKLKTLGGEELEKEQKEEAKRKREQKQLRKAAQEGGVTPDVRVVENVEDKPTVSKIEETEEKSDKRVKKTSKKLKVRGKKYTNAKKSIDQKKLYALKDAVALIQSLEKRGFDESFELHLRVADNGLKGDVSLPHGTGKTLSVAVADDALITKLESGKIDFDVLVTSPSFMPKLVKFAKLLGPKGLMPNPKQGTVTENTDEAVAKFSKGLLYFKTEAKFPLIHLSVGKKSFSADQIIENIKVFVGAVGKQKVKTAHIATTMSPSVGIDIETL